MAQDTTAERLVNPRQLFVLSGPSGVGKNTIARRLREMGCAVRAVTATTRPPKQGEQDGQDYYFVAEDEFRRRIDAGRLLEHTRYVGHYYGTPVASVNEAAAGGLPVLLTIDVDGGLQIKRKWSEVTLVFIEPPSMDQLRQRLQGRGRDELDVMERRLERARQEFACADQYDFRIVNDDLEEAVREVLRIITARSGPQDEDIPQKR